MKKYGTLYGIGIGPGNPDLITVAAIKTLGRVDVILAASSSKNDHSIAQGIAGAYLPEHAQILKLDFPMTMDRAVLEKAWSDNLEQVTAVLEQGRNAAFITLGDPLIYSTFGYLLTLMRRERPEINVEVIPGITSFQAAAARTGTILCENSQNLLVVPGIRDKESLDADLAQADNAVILKAYRNLPVIVQSLQDEVSARTKGDHKTEQRDIAFISRLGLDNEIICPGLENIPEKPNYLSLILATRKRSA